MESVAKKRRIINRDSYDRFCDDLCEVLLTYLSFEQKIKFECVSKQWQRNVFKTQYKLDLNYLTIWLKNYHHYLLPIESLFKKCSFINHISCDFKTLSKDFGKFMPQKVLRKIADNCVNLRSIRFENYVRKWEEDNIPHEECFHFFKTCGENLKDVAYEPSMPDDHYRLIIRFCPNLRSLYYRYFNLSEQRLCLNEYALLTKLEEIGTIRVCDDNERILFDVFMSQCVNTIKSLRLNLFRNSGTDRIFEKISNLINLEKLDLTFYSDFDMYTCNDGFKQIAEKCGKLSHLNLKSCKYTGDGFETLNDSFKYFTQITNFQLKISLNREIEYLIPQSLMYCKRLTNICLDIPITDTTFNNLHSILPQLKVIRLKFIICTDITFKCLAKLKQLNVMDLSSCYPEDLTGITDEGMCDVLENCLQFRSFKFNALPNITLKTIDKLIEVAISRPRIRFTHLFMFISDDLEIPLFKSIIELENYPKNLEIKLFKYESIRRKYVQIYNSLSSPYI